MYRSSDAAALARTLFAVSERPGTCRITIASSHRRAEIDVDSGNVVRVFGVDTQPLGDTLLHHGVLDLEKHTRALADRHGTELVGEWLVRIGAANAEAVRQALLLQTLERVRTVLGWRASRYFLQHGVATPRLAGPRSSLAAVVWLSLLGHLEGAAAPPGPAAATRLSDFGLRLRGQLTAAGLETTGWDAALSPQDPRSSLRVALDAVGATRNTRSLHGDSHGLLLRKRAEVRRRAPAHVLLDVEPGASPETAKRAFRRLVRELHPDRFGTDNVYMARCSGEVVRALGQAVRSFAPVAPQPRNAVR